MGCQKHKKNSAFKGEVMPEKGSKMMFLTLSRGG